MADINSTVAAIATPHGKGGIAVIRITGDDAITVASKIFRAANKTTLDKVLPSTAVYGVFFDEKGDFDTGIVTLYHAPKSFTGENVAELSCHGGILAQKRLLTACFSAGAVAASPGEFTKRAFLNGKITLTQAESIGGIIDAKSEAMLQVSMLQSRGSLSVVLDGLYNRLKRLAASIYAYIDYPDEDLTDITVPQMNAELESIAQKLTALCKTNTYGQAISEGVRTVIAGAPNTGKSSLLNLLLGYDRAIVTEIEGTTRDIVSETAVLGDIVLKLSDTAGIRETEDLIEKIGIEKTIGEIGKAELLIAVFDCAAFKTQRDNALIDLIFEKNMQNKTLAVYNKSDLNKSFAPPRIFKNEIVLSAKNGDCVTELSKIIQSMFGAGLDSSMTLGEIITNARQAASLKLALAAVNDAVSAGNNLSQDMAGLDIERAMAHLAQTAGRAAGEDIVNEIFKSFCVGK